MRDESPDSAKYSQYYSDQSFWEKVQSLSGTGGCELLRKVLTLYVLLKVPTTSVGLKVILIAALGYFIAPLDAIPDLIPFLGYSDDLSLVGLVLSNLSSAITPAIEQEVNELLPRSCR